MDATRLRAFYNPFIGFLPNLGLAVILLIGGRQVINGTLTLGDFTAFYAYLLMLIAPMRQLGIALGLAQRATASGARLFELLDREPRLVAPADARPLPDGRGRVELRDVTFAYENAASPSLRDVSLVVEAGSTVALVGGTGSGKSTLVRLIGRLYDPTAGTVLVDGADVRDAGPAARCGARSPSSTTTRSCSPRPCTTTSPTGGRRRRARRSSGRPSARRPPASSPSCPTATTRAWASAA